MERQQVIAYQQDLFIEQQKNAVCPSDHCEDVHRAKAGQAKQVNKAGEKGQSLALQGLMPIVCSRNNLKRAYQQVKRNKGVAGIDQMPTERFADWFKANGESLIGELLSGSYLPEAVKQVEIPKPKGGVRKLGIPTVTDRIIQQAISQVLSPLYEVGFSSHSYGFRPGRSAHKALQQAGEYVKSGRTIVVDMDLQSFFDEVNHDRLMHRLSKKIGDKALLRLIRRYLQSGIMSGGMLSQRSKGTPQGSPLSPLLSNIVLDELDKELETRGHCFVRYADDFSIYVRSRKAGERVKTSISRFITRKLKLKVNEQKSIVCEVNKTVLLGHTLLKSGDLTIAKENVSRLKSTVRTITKRNRGVSFAQVISELTPKLRGWFEYFKYTKSRRLFRDLDAWIRRKLRCFRIKQAKRPIGLYRLLKERGIETWQSWIIALSGKGWWRKSSSPQVHQAFNLQWFREQNLFELSLHLEKFNNSLKPPSARACLVV